MAIMRALPNMAVVAVCDAAEMKSFMDVSLDWPHPIYIRLAKGGDPIVSRKENGFAIGKAIPMRKAATRRPVALMSTGVMTTNCLAAAELLAREGIDTSVLHIHSVKPLDQEAVLEHAAKAMLVVTVEEGVAIGGLGSAVTDVLVEALGQRIPPIRRLALPDAFPHKYGLQSELFEVYGLAPEQIAAAVSGAIARKDMVVA
jgi:transketolase